MPHALDWGATQTMTTRMLGVLVLFGAVPCSWAQTSEDGGFEVAAQAANTDALTPEAQVVRQLEPADGGESPHPQVPQEPVAEPQPAPAAAGSQIAPPAVSQSVAPSSVKSAEPAEPSTGLTVGLTGSARASYQSATAFPIDATGELAKLEPLLTRFRVAPDLHLGPLGLFLEADAITGAIAGAYDVASDLPDSLKSKASISRRVPYLPLSALELRKLYLEYRWEAGVFRVGQQMLNWGLGLLANDGAKDPEAGDFGQKQFGGLTYRAQLGARPFFHRGGAWRAFETGFVADLVVRDATADFAKGDRAFQGIVAVRFAKDDNNFIGAQGVYRSQTNIFVTDGGKQTHLTVLDFAGRWELLKRPERSFKIGWELAGITGTTTQARNENAAVLRLAQFGFALKSAYRIRRFTLFLDGGFASGDQNSSDDRVENFRFDRDYKVGLILFDQVLAYQTARSGARASDPDLAGLAPEGADLLGTVGSVTGAWYLFPRAKQAVTDRLDVYGGPLFAFASAKLNDPFNSRLGGGTAINSLGGTPGSYLGTEWDLGAQMRFHPSKELLLSATAEGGVFIPGDAFSLPTSGVMGPVWCARLRLSASIE